MIVLRYAVLSLCILLIASVLIPAHGFAQAADPLVSHIDPSVKPGDDFFLYANGTWFKQNPIPSSEQQNGLWELVQDTINAQIRNVCESSAAFTDAPKGSNKQKIGDFFYSGMDSTGLNSRGLRDLKSDFDMIDAITGVRGLLAAAAYLHRVSSSPLFSFGVGQDDQISSKNAIFIGQGGLSLPDRTYYFDTDQRVVDIRRKFVDHIRNMFVLMGYDMQRASAAAEHLMKLETDLARVSRKREDLRDPWKNYNKMPFAALVASTPGIDWPFFMKEAGLPDPDSVIVGQPEFVKSLEGFLSSYPLQDWKDYLRYHHLRSLARYLNDATYLEVFRFYSTALRGVPEPRPRWKRVVEQTDGSLGELVGQVYVDEYLPKGTKEKLLEIGNAIKSAYADRIRRLDWMSDATKEKALRKLNTVIMKVGYPDRWKDMSTVQTDRSSYVNNGKNVNRWRYEYMIAKYGKPVDRTEWGMTPQTYNAYYNSSNNEIVVPGCNIIIPGYEHVLADDAILYSVIGGSTFGHEITHGFDDQGSKYDEAGNLSSWWAPEDSAKFTAKTRRIVDQYNAFVAVDTLHVNGELTQGENIADLGGIMMGYDAFRKTAQYRDHALIGGLNPEKRFFLGYALAWMVNQRPEMVADQVRSNEHSPPRFRVLGPLANMGEFFETFGITDGDRMWIPPDGRIRIW